MERANLLKHYTFIFYSSSNTLPRSPHPPPSQSLLSWICQWTSPIYAPIHGWSWMWTWISEGSMWCLIELVLCLILSAHLLRYMFYLKVFSHLFPQVWLIRARLSTGGTTVTTHSRACWVSLESVGEKGGGGDWWGIGGSCSAWRFLWLIPALW